MSGLVAKRSLFYYMILALAAQVLLGVYAPRVQATIATNESDTMSRQKISTPSDHVVAFTMSGAQTFATGESILYDWPATWSWPAVATSWTTADFTFNDGTSRTIIAVGSAPSCSAGANNVSVTINVTNKTFLVTACSSYSASGAGATVTFTSIAAGTNRQLTNPSSAGSYTIDVTPPGDDLFTLAVPVVDDDQVSVSADVSAYITFDLDVSDGSHSETATPYSVDLGDLTFSTVTNESTSGVSEIYLDLDTNADNGAVVQVKSANAALSSASTGDSIVSATVGGGLSTGTTDGGYGLASVQQAAATEGTLTPVAPFNVFATTNAVGGLTTAFQTVFNTGSAPIVAADGKMVIRAVAGRSTQAADDYSDTLTFRATATY